MRAALVVAAAATAAILAAWLSGVVVRRAARGSYGWLLLPVYQVCHLPWSVVLLLAALYFSLPLTGLPEDRLRDARHALLLGLIGATAWLTVRALYVTEEVMFRRLPVDPKSNRRKRARTQIRLVRRLTAAFVTVLAIGWALMTFSPLRTFGISLLTSAGVVGIIVGLATHSTLGNAFAGVQMAFADALRVDDVVVLEGEWGRIEEVQLTHVVVRLWDERRLIVPTTYFTARPFQNWSRHEARVLGEVTLHLDYTVEVDEVRAEARRIVERSPLWDRAEWAVQLVEVTPSTVIVQVLASAADGPSAWDLRCQLREGLIRFVRDHHPQWLPRTRAEYQP